MAIANPHITATVVEATEFPDLVRRYQVTGVPKIVINDRSELLGAQPEDVFVSAVVAAQEQER